MSKPWENVSNPDYFRDVMANMVTSGLGPKESLSVRFGNQGGGHAPNYQIEAEDGRTRRFSGLSHELFHEAPNTPFEAAHLSLERFSYTGVQQLLANCRG